MGKRNKKYTRVKDLKDVLRRVNITKEIRLLKLTSLFLPTKQGANQF